MAIVLDTGAFIKGVNLKRFQAEYYTVPQVIQEIRDSNTRQTLALKFDQVITKDAPADAIEHVRAFVAASGDDLSMTDICVLALAYSLEKQRESAELRAEPTPATWIEDVGTEPQGEDEGWITPENYLSAFDTPGTKVMTTDFGIQNVALQIGIGLVSIQGMQIRHVKKWLKKCYTCFTLEENMDKEFCQKCGNHTLYRISKYVDKTGQVRYNDRLPKRFNNRGKIYPIAKPTLGKQKDNIIQREDEMMMGGRQYAWNSVSKKANPLDYDTYASMCLKGRSSESVQFGHKRRNPNEVQRKSNKKRR